MSPGPQVTVLERSPLFPPSPEPQLSTSHPQRVQWRKDRFPLDSHASTVSVQRVSSPAHDGFFPVTLRLLPPPAGRGTIPDAHSWFTAALQLGTCSLGLEGPYIPWAWRNPLRPPETSPARNLTHSGQLAQGDQGGDGSNAPRGLFNREEPWMRSLKKCRIFISLEKAFHVAAMSPVWRSRKEMTTGGSRGGELAQGQWPSEPSLGPGPEVTGPLMWAHCQQHPGCGWGGTETGGWIPVAGKGLG